MPKRKEAPREKVDVVVKVKDLEQAFELRISMLEFLRQRGQSSIGVKPEKDSSGYWLLTTTLELFPEWFLPFQELLSQEKNIWLSIRETELKLPKNVREMTLIELDEATQALYGVSQRRSFYVLEEYGFFQGKKSEKFITPAKIKQLFGITDDWYQHKNLGTYNYAHVRRAVLVTKLAIVYTLNEDSLSSND
jgi:hypothetical protein